MMLGRVLLALWFFGLQGSYGVIFYLNDTEYDRMPPLFALDQFDRCLRHRGTYCVAKFELFAEPPNELIQLIHEYSEHSPKHYNHTYIERGICLHDTCRHLMGDKNAIAHPSEVLRRVLNECVNETIWKEYGVQTKLDEIYSCSDNQSAVELDLLDWAVATVVAALLVANLIGTAYDVIAVRSGLENNKKKGNLYLLSFSIVSNCENLASEDIDTRGSRFRSTKGLYGIKFYVSILVVLLHTQILHSAGFIDNPHEYEKAHDHIFYRLLLNGLIIVQIFFVISGFLLTYNLQIASKSNNISWSSLPKILVKRWWRLTPPYALVVAFSASWLRHLGSGPLWNHYVTNAVTNQCRRYWWMHLLYIQNYDTADQMKMCSVQSWYLAADMQAYIICLVAYMAGRSYRRNRVLAIIFLLGMLCPALNIWLQDLNALSAINPEFFRSLRDRTFLLLHTRGHNNLVGPVLGMITGYQLYDWQKNGVDLSKNKVCRYLCWLTVPAMLGVFYTGHVFSEGDRALLAARVVYGMLLRPVFCAVTAFMIMAIVMNWEEKFLPLWNWRPLVVLGKLSYSVFLLHMFFIHVLLGNRTQLGHSSIYNTIVTTSGIVMLSYLAALPFHILVEAPVTGLMNVYTATKDLQHKD